MTYLIVRFSYCVYRLKQRVYSFYHRGVATVAAPELTKTGRIQFPITPQ